MQLFAFLFTLVVVTRFVTSTSDFDLYDDDVPGTLPNLALQDDTTSSVHIILEGLNAPISADQLQAVKAAFKESYNEIYGQEGFHMESVEVIEQHVYSPERKFLRATTKYKLGFEPESYLTLVTTLRGTSGTNLGVFGDADYRILMQRFWERKACQIILTGRYTSAELRMCYMTRPRRRTQMSVQSAVRALEVVMA